MISRCFIYLQLIAWPFHSITAQNFVSNPGFESGTNGWRGPSISNRSSQSHSGTNSLFVSASPFFGGVDQTVTQLPQPGTFFLSAWIKTWSDESNIRMRLFYIDDAGQHVLQTTNFRIVTTYWVNISHAFEFAPVGTVTNFSVGFFNSAPTNTLFSLDDVSLVNTYPTLTLASVSNNYVIFEWPLEFAGYTHQSTSNLFGTNWTDSPGGFDTTSGIYRYRIFKPQQNTFYRLRRP